MRVLITGGAGFIGSHLADHLNSNNYVYGVDNFVTGTQRNVGDWECDDINVADRGWFYRAANHAKPDLIIHCAASYSDPNLWHRDAETNVLGTINAVLAAKHHGARLFYFNTALPPISSYAISKTAGGLYIEQSGVPYVTFRLANIYGPRNLSGPIPTFAKRIMAGEPCTVADTERDTVYIKDLVQLVTDTIDIPEAHGVYDVCSGNAHPILDYYTYVAEALGNYQPVEVTPAVEGDVKNMQLDPGRAMFELGWTPTTELRDGIAETVAWYQQHPPTETFTHLAAANG